MDIKEFISREKARADCFRFLAGCFYQPQKEVFISDGLFRNLSASLKQAYPDVAGLCTLEAAFVKYGEEDLMVAYAKLFVGPDALLAPPYGSIYLDKERRVMGDSTMEVVRMYQEAGLFMDEGFRELPDHITVELEFMYYLAFREVEALENLDYEKAAHFMKVQERFRNMFLGIWVKPFCDKIIEGTDNEFYTALAGCLSVFMLESDAPDDLKLLVQEKLQGAHK